MKFRYGNMVEVSDDKSFYHKTQGAVIDHKTEQDLKLKSVKNKYQLWLGKVGAEPKLNWFYEEQLNLVKEDAQNG